MQRCRRVLMMISLGLAGCGTAPDPLLLPEGPRAVSIAPLEVALTFARTAGEDTPRTLAIGECDGASVTAFDLSAALGGGSSDAIALFNEHGYDALRERIARGLRDEPETVPLTALGLPADLADLHAAAGTNFAAHADESSVEDGPFLFPKAVAPTPYPAPVSAGDALLDYEVELAFVTLGETPLPEVPQYLGLVICNDFTDRAKLLRHLNPDDVTSGEGFTTGKSAPGYLPVGPFLVIPRDLRSFVGDVELLLAVNGQVRQQAGMELAIWDVDELFRQIHAARDRRWQYGGGDVGMPVKDGALPPRTLVLAGTPEGTAFQGISTGNMATGIIRWAAGGWDQSLKRNVIERYIASAREAGAFLQAGDRVTIHVERLGMIETPVID